MDDKKNLWNPPTGRISWNFQKEEFVYWPGMLPNSKWKGVHDNITVISNERSTAIDVQFWLNLKSRAQEIAPSEPDWIDTVSQYLIQNHKHYIQVKHSPTYQKCMPRCHYKLP